MKKQNQNPILVAASNGGVVRNETNSHGIDRLLSSKLLEVAIGSESEPLSSKHYVLTKKGRSAMGLPTSRGDSSAEE
jgi:hypothetical protein